MNWTSTLLFLAPISALASGFLDQNRYKPWVDEPKVAQFSLCFNHTCKDTAIVGLSDAQWRKVERIYHPPAKSAAAERTLVARAIGLLETLVAPMIDTHNEKAMNFQGSLAQGNQQDCIDESTNTTTFLTLMQHNGLLRYHQVRTTSTRGWFIRGMPHTTAVMRDLETGVDYAVDSWFHDNGKPAEILPVSQWRKGWHPPESRQ